MTATGLPQQVRTVTDLGAERIEREIPGVGLLTFENAEPGQWLTQKKEPAKRAKRVYALDDRELDAVSSIVGCLDKPALQGWYERCGAIGATRAIRLGEIDESVPEDEVIDRVRMLGLGADTQKRDAADRGTVIHAVFEALARGEDPPNPADFPEEARPWLRGAMRAWLALDPQAFEIEQITCHPEHGYAGRPDLAAYVKGVPTLLDYKTGKGRIYVESQYQVRLYEEARRACGQEPCERLIVVGVNDEGGFELCESAASVEDTEALLSVFRSQKRLQASIASQRAAAKAALKAAA